MASPELQSTDLADGENVLWSDWPVVAMTGQDSAYQRVFGLFFAGFAVVWIIISAAIFGASMAAHARPVVFVFSLVWLLFGLPFLGVGLYFAFGANIAAAQRLRSTLYALTDRRVIVVTEGRLRSVKGYDLGGMFGAEKQTRADGCGSIIFQLKDGSSLAPSYTNRYRNQIPNMQPPGFYGVKDVDSVYRLLEQARSGKRDADTP